MREIRRYAAPAVLGQHSIVFETGISGCFGTHGGTTHCPGTGTGNIADGPDGQGKGQGNGYSGGIPNGGGNTTFPLP